MPTLLSMRADVLREADLTAGQVDDADVTALLNGELAALWELLASSWEGWAATDATLVVPVAGEVAVPADFYRPIDVTDLLSVSNPVSLPAFEFLDRNRTSTKGWCVNAGKLLVRPLSVAAGSYILTYQPAWLDLVLDGDLTALPNNWHFFAGLGAAARLRGMQELSATELEKRRDDMLVRIQQGATRRKGPRKVRDVRGISRFGRRSPNDWRENG